MEENKKTITVTAPLLPNLEEFNELLKEIWASKWITNNGSFHKQLEKALCEYLKVPYNITLLVAQGAAIVAYVPVGIVASKLGRKKTILAGVATGVFESVEKACDMAVEPKKVYEPQGADYTECYERFCALDEKLNV